MPTPLAGVLPAPRPSRPHLAQPQPCQGRPVTQTVGGSLTRNRSPVSGCPPRGARRVPWPGCYSSLRAGGELWGAGASAARRGCQSCSRAGGGPPPPLTPPRVTHTSPAAWGSGWLLSQRRPTGDQGAKPSLSGQASLALAHHGEATCPAAGTPGTFPVTLREPWPRLGPPAACPGSSVATPRGSPAERCPGAPGTGFQHQPGCPGG